MINSTPIVLPILFGGVLAFALLALAIIDVKSYLLPNALTLPLIPLGIFQGWVLTQDWQAGAIGAAAGYGIFVAIELGFKQASGKDGLGRGDAKLLAAGGAWCGWMNLPIIILIASCMGLIFALSMRLKSKDAGTWIPFGPFLAISIFTAWLAMQIA